MLGTARVEAVGKELLARDQVLKELKTNIKSAQERMNEKHQGEEFVEGDWVFLKLHPYRQASVYLSKNTKLSAPFYGPFQIIKKISPVAYKLDLPQGSRIHQVFHVNLLKRYLSSKHIDCPHLPEVLEDGRMSPKP
jgi:hypothetical protein